MPISAKLISKSVGQAQSKIEGMNFDARKHLLDYDDVLNKQRTVIYQRRQELLEAKAHPQVLSVLDMLWMNHLENIEALMDAVRIRAYGQHDPLVEFRREGHIMYQQLIVDFEDWVKENADKLDEVVEEIPLPAKPLPESDKKVGRNDPCPCGSGKKYKKCHGA